MQCVGNFSPWLCKYVLQQTLKELLTLPMISSSTPKASCSMAFFKAGGFVSLTVYGVGTLIWMATLKSNSVQGKITILESELIRFFFFTTPPSHERATRKTSPQHFYTPSFLFENPVILSKLYYLQKISSRYLWFVVFFVVIHDKNFKQSHTCRLCLTFWF